LNSELRWLPSIGFSQNFYGAEDAVQCLIYLLTGSQSARRKTDLARIDPVPLPIGTSDLANRRCGARPSFVGDIAHSRR
jgi:hypothetical protein